MKDARNDFLPYIATADGRLQNLSYTLINFKDKKNGNHAHCELCWITICESANLRSEKEGYYCAETGCWLCKKCFSDFAGKFDWHEIKEAGK